MLFTKMNGIGNDYIFFDETKSAINLSHRTIKFLCDRHYGIGGDGIVIYKKCDNADFAMRIYNADGSEAEMCGNALRCLVKLVKTAGLTEKTNLVINTKAGNRSGTLHHDGSVSVNMGKPFSEYTSLTVEGVTGYIVDVGNPHFVVIASNKQFDKVASVISEKTDIFPNRINVEFVSIKKEDNIAIMRVFERGSGETLACGTGATAAFAVATHFSLLQNDATIRLKGGDLRLLYNNKGEILLKGNATINYTGQIERIENA